MTKNKSRNPPTKKGGRTITVAKAAPKTAAGKTASAKTTAVKTMASKTASTARRKPAAPATTTAAAKKTAPRKNTKSASSPAASAPSLTERVVAAVDSLKGKDIVCIDVRQLTDVTDTLVIVSGTSNRHVKSLADHATLELKKAGKRAYNIEGAEAGEWVLVDFGDVVLHVMQPHIREFYDLEKLWGTPVDDSTVGSKAPANKKPPPQKTDQNRE